MGDDVLSAAQKMIDHEIDCLPVVDVKQDDGKREYCVRGRISKTNIVRLFVDIGQGSRRVNE